eukprot:scaffold5303_cov392-Prasinococcus_capsulatus_cf.AAC.6
MLMILSSVFCLRRVAQGRGCAAGLVEQARPGARRGVLPPRGRSTCRRLPLPAGTLCACVCARASVSCSRGGSALVMVVFVLSMRADVEGVEEIKKTPGQQWCLDLKASDSDEERKGVFVSDDEQVELSTGRASANFVMKWPGTSKEASVDVVDLKGVTRSYTRYLTRALAPALGYSVRRHLYELECPGVLCRADSGAMVPIVAFDCRGVEPTAWYPQSGFQVVSEKGGVFDDVDLKEGDWTEYDDENDLAVSILEHYSAQDIQQPSTTIVLANALDLKQGPDDAAKRTKWGSQHPPVTHLTCPRSTENRVGGLCATQRFTVDLNRWDIAAICSRMARIDFHQGCHNGSLLHSKCSAYLLAGSSVLLEE